MHRSRLAVMVVCCAIAPTYADGPAFFIAATPNGDHIVINGTSGEVTRIPEDAPPGTGQLPFTAGLDHVLGQGVVGLYNLPYEDAETANRRLVPIDPSDGPVDLLPVDLPDSPFGPFMSGFAATPDGARGYTFTVQNVAGVGALIPTLLEFDLTTGQAISSVYLPELTAGVNALVVMDDGSLLIGDGLADEEKLLYSFDPETETLNLLFSEDLGDSVFFSGLTEHEGRVFAGFGFRGAIYEVDLDKGAFVPYLVFDQSGLPQGVIALAATNIPAAGVAAPALLLTGLAGSRRRRR